MRTPFFAIAVICLSSTAAGAQSVVFIGASTMQETPAAVGSEFELARAPGVAFRFSFPFRTGIVALAGGIDMNIMTVSEKKYEPTTFMVGVEGRMPTGPIRPFGHLQGGLFTTGGYSEGFEPILVPGGGVDFLFSRGMGIRGMLDYRLFPRRHDGLHQVVLSSGLVFVF